MGDKRGTYRVLVGRLVATKPLGRPRCRWEDNIKIDLLEIGEGGMGWIDLAQERNRMAGTCKCGNKFVGSIKCG
jgi:hypothetical protein